MNKFTLVIAGAFALTASPAVASEVYGPTADPATIEAQKALALPYRKFTLKPGETIDQMDHRYHRDFNRWRIAGWVAAAADIASTERCLHKRDALGRPVCHEANPLYGRNPSTFRMLATRVPLEIGLDLLAQRIFKRDPQAAITFVQVKAIGTGIIAGLNMRF